MEIFAMIFAVFMIAAAIAATAIIGMMTGFWGGLGFAVFLILIYRAFTWQPGPSSSLRRKNLNAFQKPLSKD